MGGRMRNLGKGWDWRRLEKERKQFLTIKSELISLISKEKKNGMRRV